MYFCHFPHFPHFRKNEENVGFLYFLVFSQNAHFYKISFFYTIVKKGGFRNIWDLIKIDVFSMCVFRYGIPRCDVGTPRWNRYREVDTAHIHFGVVIFDDSDGDGEMGRWGDGMSMCGRFGD